MDKAVFPTKLEVEEDCVNHLGITVRDNGSIDANLPEAAAAKDNDGQISKDIKKEPNEINVDSESKENTTSEEDAKDKVIE